MPMAATTTLTRTSLSRTIRLVAWALVEVDTPATNPRRLVGLDANGELHFPPPRFGKSPYYDLNHFLAPGEELDRASAIVEARARLSRLEDD